MVAQGGAPARGAFEPWSRGGRLVLVLLVAGVLVHLPALTNRSYNSDEGYLATQAQVLNDGGRLYVDIVDRKPPLVPYLYAAAFAVTGDDDLLAVRVLAVLAWVLTAWLLAIEARRRYSSDRAGLVAGLLFLGASGAFFARDGQTANFEVFMLPAIVASIALAGRRRPFASGLALGVATLAKQTAATTLLPLVWIVWTAAPNARDRTRRLALLGAGVLVPVAAAAAAFGPHEFGRWVLTSNGGYLDAGNDVGFVAQLFVTRTALFVLANAALLALAAWAWRRRRDDIDLWLWVASGVVATASGFRFFGHYYVQILPPLCLLAASSLVNASRRALAVVAAAVIVPVVVFGIPAQFGSEAEPVRIARDLASYARRHTGSTQRILVWGHLPEVYWYSERHPATRFATTGFLTGQSGGRPADHAAMRYATPGAWDDFARDLRAHPPALVFDLSSADVRNAKHAPPGAFPRFGDYLRRHYRVVGHVDRVAVYVRR